MRPLKFRAWMPNLASDKKMIYGKDFAVGGDGKAFWCGFDNYPFESEDVVMQYTGLKDKTGKEIYEGDILKYEDEHLDRPAIYVVEFHGGAFVSIHQEDAEYSEHINEFGADTREIIGNIYENPSLLTSAQSEAESG